MIMTPTSSPGQLHLIPKTRPLAPRVRKLLGREGRGGSKIAKAKNQSKGRSRGRQSKTTTSKSKKRKTDTKTKKGPIDTRAMQSRGKTRTPTSMAAGVNQKVSVRPVDTSRPHATCDPPALSKSG